MIDCTDANNIPDKLKVGMIVECHNGQRGIIIETDGIHFHLDNDHRRGKKLHLGLHRMDVKFLWKDWMYADILIDKRTVSYSDEPLVVGDYFVDVSEHNRNLPSGRLKQVDDEHHLGNIIGSNESKYAKYKKVIYSERY